MSKRYSGKSFKDASVMKKAKLSLKEKRKLKKEKKKKKFDSLNFAVNPRWQLDEKANFMKGAGVKL